MLKSRIQLTELLTLPGIHLQCRNQDASVKLKSELIFINFKNFFYVIADPKPICFAQTISSMFELQKEAKFEASFTNIFPGIPVTGG